MQKEHLRKTRREGRREKGRVGGKEEEMKASKTATVFGTRGNFFCYKK